MNFTTTADRFLLIRPDYFEIGACPDNRFASAPETPVDREKAFLQHQAVVDMLRSFKKTVQVFPGKTSDDTFSNNVFATNHEKTLLVGVMAHEARKKEADREDIKRWFESQGYRIIELSSLTSEPVELTGVLVIDHAKNIGFCGLSDRCTEKGSFLLQKVFNLESLFSFPLTIYHANVGLSILAGKVLILCPSMFQNSKDADHILSLYLHHIVLTEEQMNNFAANVLAITEEDMVISTRGFEAFGEKNRKQLSQYGFAMHHCDLSELEKSGGSMRCLITEIF